MNQNQWLLSFGPGGHFRRNTHRLNGMDLYDLQFGQIRGKTFQVVEEREDLGWEELQPTFTAVTGLDTHL
ncbi:MAG: hypothetical protein WCF05_11340 [Chromatiaceae bacterium]